MRLKIHLHGTELAIAIFSKAKGAVSIEKYRSLYHAQKRRLIPGLLVYLVHMICYSQTFNPSMMFGRLKFLYDGYAVKGRHIRYIHVNAFLNPTFSRIIIRDTFQVLPDSTIILEKILNKKLLHF